MKALVHWCAFSRKIETHFSGFFRDKQHTAETGSEDAPFFCVRKIRFADLHSAHRIMLLCCV